MTSQMTQNSNSFQAKKPANRQNSNNFVEALKSIGDQTTSSFTKDVVGGVSKDFLQALTNSNRSNNRNSEKGPNDVEAQIRQEALALQRHREVTETKIFDRKEKETKEQIEAIQDELKLLIKELAGMDKELENAIEAEIVNPGTYHISFFQKLRRFLIDLRKRVSDSSSWLEASSYRKSSQRGYWGNVAKSGSKYMMSQERTLATQAG